MSDEETLEAALRELPKEKRIAFAASCAERLVSCYYAYCLHEGRGSYDRVRAALDAVWELLRGRKQATSEIDTTLRRLEPIVATLGEEGGLFAEMAMYAVGVTMDALQCCLDDDASHAVDAALATYSAIDSYTEFVNGPLVGLSVLFGDQVEVPSSEAVRSRLLFRYNRLEAEFPSTGAWGLESPLRLCEQNRQQHDLELLNTTDLDSETLDYLRYSASMEGIQPIARGLVHTRPKRPRRSAPPPSRASAIPDVQPDKSPVNPVATVPARERPSVWQEGHVGDLLVSSNSYRVLQVVRTQWADEVGFPSRRARRGFRWLEVEAHWVINPDGHGEEFDASSFQLADAEGHTYEAHPHLGAHFLDVHSWIIGKDQRVHVHGAVGFLVRAKATGLRMEFDDIAIWLQDSA